MKVWQKNFIITLLATPLILSAVSIGCSTGRMQNLAENASNGAAKSKDTDGTQGVEANNLKDSRGGVKVPEIATVERCISILRTIPDQLRRKYDRQTEVSNDDRFTTLDRLDDQQIRLFVYTYSIPEGTHQTGLRTCDVPHELKKDVAFWGREINRILESYVTAVLYNKEQQSISARNLSLDGPESNSVSLCQDVRCGPTQTASRKSFSVANESDLEYAEIISDTILGVNTKNDIVRLRQNDDRYRTLSDAEINELLLISRSFAVDMFARLADRHGRVFGASSESLEG